MTDNYALALVIEVGVIALCYLLNLLRGWPRP